MRFRLADRAFASGRILAPEREQGVIVRAFEMVFR